MERPDLKAELKGYKETLLNTLNRIEGWRLVDGCWRTSCWLWSQKQFRRCPRNMWELRLAGIQHVSIVQPTVQMKPGMRQLFSVLSHLFYPRKNVLFAAVKACLYTIMLCELKNLNFFLHFSHLCSNLLQACLNKCFICTSGCRTSLFLVERCTT